MLEFSFKCYTSTEESSQPRPLYHKGDYNLLTEMLRGVEWEKHDGEDVDSMWTFFKDKMGAAVEQSIPKVKETQESRKSLGNIRSIASNKR